MVRMFLTPRISGPGATGRREKSDHPTVEEAQAAYDGHPNRREYEALIYVDGVPTWVGTIDQRGRVSWAAWRIH
jgi:hypothetical protein